MQWRMRASSALLWLMLPLAASGQDAGPHFQDSRFPAGPQAAHIHDLWQLMLWVCGIAFVATMIALALALMRARRGDERTPPDLTSLQQTERGQLHSVSMGT